MSNCRGCGSVVDPTLEEANQAVNEVLVASLKDAKKHGEICPLCGHSQAQPVSQRKWIQFVMLAALLLISLVIGLMYSMHRDTERQAVAAEVLKQLEDNSQITEFLGKPLSIQGKVGESVKQDETPWHEAKLSIPVHGPNGDGIVQVSGGREAGPWKLTTMEVVMPQLKKKADLITGRIVEYSPDAYVDTHTEAASVPEYVMENVPAPRWNGDFPCVYVMASSASAPQVGNCTTPVPMSKASRTPAETNYHQHLRQIFQPVSVTPIRSCPMPRWPARDGHNSFPLALRRDVSMLCRLLPQRVMPNPLKRPVQPKARRRV